MPKENAISVAIGIALPLNISSPSATIRKIKIGSTIPPTAAITGNKACFTDDNSPTNTSLFISSPTEKKKIAIRASFINCIRVIGSPWWLNRLKFPICNETGTFHQEKYIDAKGELAIIMANTVTIINTYPPFV